MNPAVEVPPVVVATCLLMVVLFVPVTLAVICFVWAAWSVRLVGEMATLIVVGVGLGVGVGVGVGVGLGAGVGVGVGVGPVTFSDNGCL